MNVKSNKEQYNVRKKNVPRNRYRYGIEVLTVMSFSIVRSVVGADVEIEEDPEEKCLQRF